MYDRANKMERAFFDKKGKDMGIKETNHDYFVGILGELALREYLHFNRVHHNVDDIIKSDFGDDFDVQIGSKKFDVKTQKFNKQIYLSSKIWDKMDFKMYPQQVEKLVRKKIDYVYRVVLNVDYSYAHLIGYLPVSMVNQYETDADMGKMYKIPFSDLNPPHLIMYEFHEGAFSGT